jgi:hypothetical protein
MEKTAEYYKSYDYLMVIRKLQLPNRKPTNKENFPNLEDFIIVMNNTPYKINKGELMRSGFKVNKEEDLSTVFCSELVSVFTWSLCSQFI